MQDSAVRGENISSTSWPQVTSTHQSRHTDGRRYNTLDYDIRSRLIFCCFVMCVIIIGGAILDYIDNQGCYVVALNSTEEVASPCNSLVGLAGRALWLAGASVLFILITVTLIFVRCRYARS